jgi:hypothetical protein
MGELRIFSTLRRSSGLSMYRLRLFSALSLSDSEIGVENSLENTLSFMTVESGAYVEKGSYVDQ